MERREGPGQSKAASEAAEPVVPELLSELLLPVLAAGLAIYYLVSVRALPWIARAHGLVVGYTLLALVLLLGIRLGLQARHKRIPARVGLLVARLGLGRRDRWLLVLWMLALTVAMPQIGFAPSVLLFLAVCMVTLRVHNLGALFGVSVLTSLVGYLLFVAFLKVQLPLGPVERWLGGLLGG